MGCVRERYQGQVAVITGAASGIGRAIALRLAEEGARIALWDMDAAALSGAESDVAARGAESIAQILNVSEEDHVKSAFDRVIAKWGRLDVLVHAAGIVGPTTTPISDYRSESFRQVLDVNLTGSFLVSKYAIGLMLPRNYGRVLLLSSMAGKEGNPGMAGYVASKAGVIGLVKALGKEVATNGVTVNGLAPAVVATPMNKNTSQEMLQYMIDKIPMRRIGSTEEVAALACWICSPEASFNTGFVFDLSGGRATY